MSGSYSHEGFPGLGNDVFGEFGRSLSEEQPPKAAVFNVVHEQMEKSGGMGPEYLATLDTNNLVDRDPALGWHETNPLY